jgi:hypothetical protein
MNTLIESPPDPFAKPTKPSMHIIDINLIGVMYTFKLAVHYFRRSPLEAQRDRCFIFGGSLVGYVDNLVGFLPVLVLDSITDPATE